MGIPIATREKAGVIELNGTRKMRKAGKKCRQVMVEFILKLRDRNGKERELRGFVEEGTTRNDAVAKLVREKGGFCEMKEGEGELAGLRWISRIEFDDGFKIEDWGQYATINGEFEIGRPDRSLVKKLMAVFFKKFRANAFWENGDTKRIMKGDNVVLFREDYGMKGELPRAEAMLNSGRFRPEGGCGGAITKGELELVKLAARIDFKRDEYLADLNNGLIRRKKVGHDTRPCLLRVLAPPELKQFDAITKDTSSPMEHKTVLDPAGLAGYCFPGKRNEIILGDFFHGTDLQDGVENVLASPDLFFSRYEKGVLNSEKDGSRDEEGQEEDVKSDITTGEANEDARGRNRAESRNYENNKSEEETKQRKRKSAKREAEEAQVLTEEKDKILSIIRQLGGSEGSKNEKREEMAAKKTEEEAAVEKKKNDKKSEKKAKKRNDKGRKERVRKKIPQKTQQKKNNEQKKAYKIGKKQKKAPAKKAVAPEKTAGKKEELPKTRQKAGTKPKEKRKRSAKVHAEEKEKAKKAGRIKLRRIIIEKNKIWKPQKPPQAKNRNPEYRKGAELAHRLFLKALKNMERKRMVAAMLMAGDRRCGSSNKKPRNKV